MPFSFSSEDLDLLHLPVVHLNGTGKNTLTEEYQLAFDKLKEAIEAFNKTTFHQRDFYVSDDAASSNYYSAQALRWKMQMIYKILADYLYAHTTSFKGDKDGVKYIIEDLKKILDDYK